ncbi:MAG: acylphosphatase [Ktedonobacterales bacterium]
MTQERPGSWAQLRAVVHGAVQGVGFRFFARREALVLGLSGYTRNQADGTVEVIAEGGRRALEIYLKRLQRGPSEAEVDWVEQNWDQASGGFTDFQIRH